MLRTQGVRSHPACGDRTSLQVCGLSVSALLLYDIERRNKTSRSLMAGIIGNCLAASAHSAAAGPGYGCTAVSRCQDTVSFDACGAWQSEDTHPSRNGWPAGPSESRSQCMAFPRPAPVLLRHCCVQAEHCICVACAALSQEMCTVFISGAGEPFVMEERTRTWTNSR